MYLVLVQVRLLIRRFIRLWNKGYAWISNSDWKSHPVTTSGYDFQLPLWIKFYCEQKSPLNFELKLQYFNFLSENLYNYSCMCTPPLSSKKLPFQKTVCGYKGRTALRKYRYMKKLTIIIHILNTSSCNSMCSMMISRHDDTHDNACSR